MSTPSRDPNDTTPLIEPPSSISSTPSPKFLDRPYAKIILGVSFLAALILVGGLTVFFSIPHERNPAPSVEELHSCAWPYLETSIRLLNVSPIDKAEFLRRQAILAAALKDDAVDLYITEPSPSSLYYFNISTSYSLSERPFLAILSSNGAFSYLAPKFELGRIADLDMVYREKTVIEWKEEESPYAALKRELGNKTVKVMVDEHARFFIASGLQAANFTVLPISPAIASMRTVKSTAELRILGAINYFTIKVVRSLQPCIRVGVTQETLFDAAHSLFNRAGVGHGFWATVLFGEQAANPHGGSRGKSLGHGEFVLIDIGSKLLEYGSDVTRTILPPGSSVSNELLHAWYLVKDAQNAAVRATTEGRRCSDVDAASR
jgi:Xaa-Pro aminopeptidase